MQQSTSLELKTASGQSFCKNNAKKISKYQGGIKEHSGVKKEFEF